ncbi:DinB family protein [Pseudalkalibacillus sp. SCS-8]|uniref:DinB family protein n=1 Tax=Pseudalkalibacillus nanhaiensis TaxID=3115291 RepID=UPI0032DB4B35
MQFEFHEALEILRRTPAVLSSMLEGLPDSWTRCNEGEGTWGSFDVVGHLNDGERKDWLERVSIIHEQGENLNFRTFDRFEHLKRNSNRTLTELLEEFRALRMHNIEKLESLITPETDLKLKGIHPAFGEVTLHQLLSTWVVHDLDHISQISRVMAKRYQEDVGPWKAYLRILSEAKRD